jgi:hypothetical protein
MFSLSSFIDLSLLIDALLSFTALFGNHWNLGWSFNHNFLYLFELFFELVISFFPDINLVHELFLNFRDKCAIVDLWHLSFLVFHLWSLFYDFRYLGLMIYQFSCIVIWNLCWGINHHILFPWNLHFYLMIALLSNIYLCHEFFINIL